MWDWTVVPSLPPSFPSFFSSFLPTIFVRFWYQRDMPLKIFWSFSLALDEGEGGEWKSQLKTKYLKKTNIMASTLITAWQIEGEKLGVVTEFLFLGSKITEDGECSREIRRRLLLGRKAMTNLESVLKSRDVSLPTKVRRVKAMVSPVITCSCER